MDAFSAINRSAPTSSRGTQPYAGAEGLPADRFAPSSAEAESLPVDRFTPSASSPLTARERADREADAALLRQCGDGCGCLSCSPVAGDDDPLKTLRERDAEVRAHEAEHFNAAGEFAVGGPSYDFVTTRSGQTFAVGGKVHVDIAEIAGDPKRTLEKMEKLRRAALAPLKPSEQDLRVASQASMKAYEAQQKLAQMEPQRTLATA